MCYTEKKKGAAAMNDTIRQLKDRKSVRVYEDRPVEAEVKATIIDAAIQAPTAGNMSLYTILDITDPTIKAALAESCDHQPFIATAPLVLIFCADYRRWHEAFTRYAPGARNPGMGDLFLAQADAIIAAQNAVVAAQSLGLGSCYIGDIIENFEYHRELLKLPEHVVPAAMVCFGYPTEHQLRREKPARFKAEDLVHENGYDLDKSEALPWMVMERQVLSDDEVPLWLKNLARRKWDSEFSREMNRSAQTIADDWCGK